MSTLFSRIIDGDLPVSLVHRDELCIVFMDIHPMAYGHVLVCPLQGVSTLDELPLHTRSHLWEVARRVGVAQRASLGSLAQHYLVNDGRHANQSVPHVHIHVIPRYRGDGLTTIFRIAAHIGVILIKLPISARARRRLDAQADLIRSALEGMADIATSD